MTNKFTATILASVFLITITSCNSGDKSNDRNINLIQDSTSFENYTTTDTRLFKPSSRNKTSKTVQSNSCNKSDNAGERKPKHLQSRHPTSINNSVATNPEVTSTSTAIRSRRKYSNFRRRKKTGLVRRQRCHYRWCGRCSWRRYHLKEERCRRCGRGCSWCSSGGNNWQTKRQKR